MSISLWFMEKIHIKIFVGIDKGGYFRELA